MNRGKRKCELLLRMRARVAARYGLEYNPHECKHEEDCSGTCPLCNAELADLERQLQNRHITNIDQEGCSHVKAHWHQHLHRKQRENCSSTS